MVKILTPYHYYLIDEYKNILEKIFKETCNNLDFDELISKMEYSFNENLEHAIGECSEILENTKEEK